MLYMQARVAYRLLTAVLLLRSGQPSRRAGAGVEPSLFLLRTNLVSNQVYFIFRSSIYVHTVRTASLYDTIRGRCHDEDAPQLQSVVANQAKDCYVRSQRRAFRV